jgi:hypothetical protein
MNRFYRAIFWHVMFPLLIGFIIYFLFRKGTWIHAFFISSNHHQPLILTKGTIARIIAYNLPDFCWSYSFSCALFIWKKIFGKEIKRFPIIVFTLLLTGEIIQFFFPSAFTFDWLDIIAAVLGFSLSWLQTDRYEKL